MISCATVFGAALRIWMRRRLGADEEIVVCSDEVARCAPALQRLTTASGADSWEIAPRVFPYLIARGAGTTPQAAISSFQYDLEMRLRLPWRVHRVWWRHEVCIEASTDFASRCTVYSVFARFAFEPAQDVSL